MYRLELAIRLAAASTILFFFASVLSPLGQAGLLIAITCLFFGFIGLAASLWIGLAGD